MARRKKRPPKPRTGAHSRLAGRRRARKVGRKILLALFLAFAVLTLVHRPAWLRGPWRERAGESEIARTEIVGEQNPDTPPAAARPEETREDEAAPSAPETDSPGGGNGDGGTEAGMTPGRLHGLSLRPLLRRAFAVRTVRLEGGYSVSRDTLLARLGRLEGAYIFDLDLEALAGRLSAHPRIRRALLRRRLPGTLLVHIEDRRELVLVVRDGRLFGLDRDGVALPPPVPGWPLDVPLVTGYRGELAPGRRTDDPELKKVLLWAGRARSRPRVEEWIVEFRLEEGVLREIYCRGGCRVIPGKHSAAAQLAALDAFLANGEPREAAGGIVDLRFPDFLIVRGGGRPGGDIRLTGNNL